MNWFKRAVANRLFPELIRESDRFWYLRGQMSDAGRWLGYEYPQVDIVLSWLMYRDVDHWRALDEQPKNKWPSEIYSFREWLRTNYPAPPLPLDKGKGGSEKM